MKPLSLVLIEQLFSFMGPLGFITYQIELEGVQWQTMRTLVLNCKHPDITFPTIDLFEEDTDTLDFKKDGMTLTFVEKK